ncbi:hypothetical protein SEPL_398 [Salmonella phage SE_PL]|nr:hypothetical protein 7t3_0173 [Salmonella phage 7t3]QIG63011.1 hypothetical protein SEPL_398 [Salmonella phage SE_PL]
MEKEFDSSDYECALDYAFHIEQTQQRTETEAIMLAAKYYNINWQSLQRYADSFNI